MLPCKQRGPEFDSPGPISKILKSQEWSCLPVIPVLKRKKQEDGLRDCGSVSLAETACSRFRMRTCLKGREELQKAPQGDLWHASGFPSACGSEFASQEKPHTLYLCSRSSFPPHTDVF